MSITILLFGHNVSFKRYWQFKIIWFPLSCHHSNRTISLSHKRCIHNSHIKYENASKYIYPLNEIVSLSRGQGDHESQRDNFESLGQTSTMRAIREIISQAHVPKSWAFRHILSSSVRTIVVKIAEDFSKLLRNIVG